jgi:hypothetical protein
MSTIRAANLIRCYFSGSCAAAPSVTVVGVAGDPNPIVTAFVPNLYGMWGLAVPIQWEIKNDSSVPLNIAFSGLSSFALTPPSGTTLANYITLNALESFTMQKRHYEQEYTPSTVALIGGLDGSWVDMTRVFVQGTTGTGAFSGTVDLWIPVLGA